MAHSVKELIDKSLLLMGSKRIVLFYPSYRSLYRKNFENIHSSYSNQRRKEKDTDNVLFKTAAMQQDYPLHIKLFCIAAKRLFVEPVVFFSKCSPPLSKELLGLGMVYPGKTKHLLCAGYR
jgi:hypothetical protein